MGDTGHETKRTRARPWAYALVLSVTYLAAASAWIVVSGRRAETTVRSVQELAHVELLKGLGFVGITALALFGLSYVLFRRIRQDVRRLEFARDAVLRSERRALAGVLAASIAHDAANLLSVVNANLSLLEEDLVDAPEARAAYRDTLGATEALLALFSHLRDVGREQAGGPVAEVDLSTLVDETVRLARRHPRVHGARIEVEAERLSLRGQATLLHQMILNLLVNAGDAAGEKGRVRVRLRREGEEAVLTVEDDGPGVPSEVRERIFEAFFTTRDEGTGLGLLSVKACAQAHGGQVSVQDSSLGGACFGIRLPMPAGGAVPTRARA